MKNDIGKFERRVNLVPKPLAIDLAASAAIPLGTTREEERKLTSIQVN